MGGFVLFWHKGLGFCPRGVLSRGAAFGHLANSPPAISPSANGPPAKSPPPAAVRPPPPSYMPIAFLLIIIIVVVLHGRPQRSK